MHRLPIIAVGAASLALGLAACGGSSSSSSSGTSSAPASSASSSPATSTSAASSASSAAPASGGSTLTQAADPSGALKFTKSSLAAKAGKVTVNFDNASMVPHNFTIEQGSSVVGATPTFSGGSKTLTVTLKPGTYTFFCSVDGHRAAGMQGTLTVQ